METLINITAIYAMIALITLIYLVLKARYNIIIGRLDPGAMSFGFLVVLIIFSFAWPIVWAWFALQVAAIVLKPRTKQ
jgi:hypothetical protein